MNAVTNASPLAGASAAELVDIIDFKWMMSAAGYHVHVERLQTDPEYVRECLACAEASPDEALRAAARRLRQRLAAAGR